MKKFNVGDKVRCIDYSGGGASALHPDYIYTVTGYNEFDNVELEGFDYGFFEYRFVLVEEEKKNMPKFKVGDKVRCINNMHSWTNTPVAGLTVGNEYTVESINEGGGKKFLRLVDVYGGWDEKKFVLVAEENKNMPKFKVGDRILVNDRYPDENMHGLRGVISHRSACYWGVKMDSKLLVETLLLAEEEMSKLEKTKPSVVNDGASVNPSFTVGDKVRVVPSAWGVDHVRGKTGVVTSVKFKTIDVQFPGISGTLIFNSDELTFAPAYKPVIGDTVIFVNEEKANGGIHLTKHSGVVVALVNNGQQAFVTEYFEISPGFEHFQTRLFNADQLWLGKASDIKGINSVLPTAPCDYNTWHLLKKGDKYSAAVWAKENGVEVWNLAGLHLKPLDLAMEGWTYVEPIKG